MRPGAAQAYTGGPYAVTSPATDGGTITCTITNKQKTSTVRVVKDWVGATVTTTIFVDAGRRGAVRRLDRRNCDRRQPPFTYPISTPVTVGETPVPAGYAATIQCGTGARSRTRVHRSRSPPPPSAAPTHHVHDHQHSAAF